VAVLEAPLDYALDVQSHEFHSRRRQNLPPAAPRRHVQHAIGHACKPARELGSEDRRVTMEESGRESAE